MKKRFLAVLLIVVLFVFFLVPVSAIDWLSYPSSNHFDFTNNVLTSIDTTRGTTVVDFDAQTISMTSTGDDTYAYVTNVFQLDPDTQYMVYMSTSQRAQIFLYDGEGRYQSQSSTSVDPTFVFTTPSDGKCIFRFDNADELTTCVFSNIMMVKGRTRYPYQPFIPSAIADAEQEAYDAGQYDASLIGNLLAGARYLEFTYTIRSDDPTLHPVSPVTQRVTFDQLEAVPFYDDGTLNISQFFYDEVGPLSSGLYITSFELFVMFDSMFSYNNNDVFLTGPSGGHVLVQGNASSAVYEEPYNDSLNLLIRSVDFPFAPVTLQSLKFRVFPESGYNNINTIFGTYASSELNDFQISFVNNGTYAEGYLNGFNEGKNSISGMQQLNERYEEGRRQGYAIGFSAGKAEGLDISENGSWLSLFTAVIDAPVQAFTGLFDFEILGLNMLSFAKSILTVCLIVTVVRFLV